MNPHVKVRCIAMLILSLVLLLAGCQVGVTRTPTPIPDLAFTQAAQTIVADLTQNAPTATETPLPTATQAPTSTETPEPTHTLAPTSTPTITAALPTPSEQQTGVLRFQDDFSSGTGWHTEQNDRFSFAYRDGGYEISVNILNAAIWSIKDQDYTDVSLEVDAARTEGPVDGYYGLVCRHQDGDNYYGFVIGSDGGYGIARMKAGEFEFLAEGAAQPGVINSGTAFNHLRADCIGESLSLFANGQKLVEIQDGSFDQGAVGMLVGTRLVEGETVLFDNFAIYEP